MYSEQEKLTQASITDIMQTAYIDYSMSVIVSRALPDARDGLKPVQRRILYAMLREGLVHNRPFDKCAGVVGEVLKNYHPHGDSSVYDTLVRLAQSWVMRYQLIEPQGNFGSVDGDPPAAYRYTECRLAEVAGELLADIDEDTVDFVPNYKESTTEPSVLPCALPHLLMNGSTGIAVGMTTNIPPHNLGELVEAVCLVIDKPSATVEDLEKVIVGPDFPTGGVINGKEGIRQYLRTGRGIVRVRGVAHTEELKNGKEQVVLTELPYNVNRAALVKHIADLCAEKVIDEVSDLRDESDENTRVVIELKRGESPRVVINKLYKHTNFENSFGVILLALDKRRPKQMTIRELIECFVEHRRDVVTRRTRFRLRKAEDRAHILEGFKIALRHLDDFVKIIRASANRDEARVKLIAKYGLSERQALAILDLRLYQLTGLERDKIEEEYRQLMALVEELRGILSSESKLLTLIKKELREAAKKHVTPRRTRVMDADGELSMEDIVANEGSVVTVSHAGFIKRTPVAQYRLQKRGGKGTKGAELSKAASDEDSDFIEHLFTANTHDHMMFFMNNGRVYVEKVYEIEEAARASRGKSIARLLDLKDDEKLAAMVCVPNFDEGRFLVMCTANGTIKKTGLEKYANVRKGGIIGVNIEHGDQLISVKLTNGDNEVVMISQSGMSIRFHESGVRSMGRDTTGVIGMNLDSGDQVKAMEVVDPACTLLVVGVDGIGKRTPFDDSETKEPVYRKQSRGGKGVIAISTEAGVAGALSVREDDEVMLLTKGGQSIRTKVADIRCTAGRATKGVRVMRLKEGETLLGISKVEKAEDEDTAPAAGPAA
ncbi:MAG: DNA gyrase subunit A [Verrucomicrobia bacterium]|nr:DNA gyrase subunit A [Verrucomicrobiota bacterium]